MSSFLKQINELLFIFILSFIIVKIMYDHSFAEIMKSMTNPKLGKAVIKAVVAKNATIVSF